MGRKSKQKTGLKEDELYLSLPKKEEKKRLKFSDSERIKIIEDYLSSKHTKREIWHKHTGRYDEKGAILKWMRKLGYQENSIREKTIFAENKNEMKKNQEELEFEIEVLKNRIKSLEKQVEDAELKAIAFSTMVDIAERELKIPVRKKFNAKPSKK